MTKFLIQLSGLANSSWTLFCFLIMQMVLFFQPVGFNVLFIGALIFVDVITALIAIFMQQKRECTSLLCAFREFYKQWTSKRAFDSIPKFIWYLMLIILSYMGGYIFDQPLALARAATGIIAYVEIRSIIENGDKAFGTNLWELLVNSIQKFFKLK